MSEDATTQYRGFTIAPDGANLIISLAGVTWARATNYDAVVQIVDLLCANNQRSETEDKP